MKHAFSPEAIRDALRDGDSPSLRRRRKIALLSAVGLVDFAAISLYQMGAIRSLPDLPGETFASNRVNASRKAYAMGLPDGTTGAALFAANLVLASAGGDRTTGRKGIFSFLLGGAIAAGALGAIDYLYDMIFRQRKACPYCILGAAIHFAMVPLVLPEVKESLAEMRGSR